MRTNPNLQSPNPATRWFQWDGQEGHLKYYDKESETTIPVELPFEFILLDRLAVVKGWHDASESGITSNEVRRINDEPLTVRAFKMKEPIAAGLYSDIKDRVKAAGGKFNTNLYIAFTGELGELEIGSLMLHGSAMSAWFNFENEKGNKKDLYTLGIKIGAFTEGKKGSIKFRVPIFEFVTIPPEAEQKAEELQKEITAYLSRYLNKKSDEPGETFVDTSSEYIPFSPDDDAEIPF